MQRRCYLMEKSPVYAEVILNRWSKLTGVRSVSGGGRSGNWRQSRALIDARPGTIPIKMKQIESGDILISPDEANEYRAAADFLREHSEILIDFSKPIPIEHAMCLKWCQVGLQGDFDTLTLALAEFDRMIAVMDTRH